jgi:hypothetical protein
VLYFKIMKVEHCALLKVNFDIQANIHTLEANRAHLLQADENRWRLKSRALWLTSGDSNTRFFHRFASHRRNKKLIWEIEDEDGNIAHKTEDIKKAAYTHFQTFFQEDPLISIQDQTTTAQLFPQLVTDEEARALEAPCTKEEIYQVLKDFKREKSPGPDGWTVELYLHFFELMGPDLLEAIEDSRNRGLVNKHLNNTFIVLIPKQNLPRHFSDYRPISLCNLSYKIITKIIANRIRPLLSRTLAEEQLGFLKGRQILDAIGTAQECLHSIKTKNLPAILLKLDLKQAFDCINWNFLHLILLQCGFGTVTTNWIMGCITTATLAVLINGEASKAFHSKRGLRQGCPLSPLLFILVLESLSILLKKSKLAGKLSGIRASRLTQILHLLFVDDVIIMTSDSLSEWTEILNILNIFCSVTGLKINLQKSMFLATGARETNMSELKSLFGIDFRDLEEGFNYLGYFIKPSSYKAKDWSWLYEKFERRIQHWCNRCYQWVADTF